MLAANGDILYDSRQQIRGKLLQKGSYAQTDLMRRIDSTRLALYERMAKQDITLKYALAARTSSIISTIGELHHIDPEINDYLTYNIKSTEDKNGKSFSDCMSEMILTSYEAGFQLSEIMFDLDFGSLYLDDVITYRPSTISIYPNKKGRLVDGQESIIPGQKSGFYQTDNQAKPTQIASWKTVYFANDSRYGSIYGNSIIAPCYKFYRLKEALIDMMSYALDRLGKRVLWVKTQPFPTNERRIDASTGEEKAVTTLQLLQEELEAAGGVPEYLLLQQLQSDNKPEVGSTPLSDNFGNAFIEAIAYLDQDMVRHITPFFLVSDSIYSSESGGGAAISRERRMENYYNIINLDRQRLTNAVIQKIFIPLIKWNFNREASNIPPEFSRVYSDRSEDRVATMQMVRGLTQDGYLNPRAATDRAVVRQMVKIPDRPLTDDDLEFIQQIVINPRQKNPRESDVGINGSGGEGKPIGASMPNQSDRLPERSK